MSYRISNAIFFRNNHYYQKMNHFISGVDLDDEKSFDPALFDVTRIPVNDFANQITLDDFEIFKRITPEEVIFRIFSNFSFEISKNEFRGTFFRHIFRCEIGS